MIIIGDCNKHVGNDEYGIKGNHDKISRGGKLIRELLATKEYVLVNNTEKAVGGPRDAKRCERCERCSCKDFPTGVKILGEFCDGRCK